MTAATTPPPTTRRDQEESSTRLDQLPKGQPWYCGESIPDTEVEVTADLVMTERFPLSFSAFELLRMHTEVLGLFIDTGLFSKGVREGQLSVRDLADAGVLRRLVELARASGVDLRELADSRWPPTPEERKIAESAQRIRERLGRMESNRYETPWSTSGVPNASAEVNR